MKKLTAFQIGSSEFISFISFFLKICSSIIILFLTLKKMESNELGLWYFFTNTGGLILLLELGLSPVVARSVSSILSKSMLFSYGEIVHDNSMIIDFSTYASCVNKIYLYLWSFGLLLFFPLTLYFYKFAHESDLNSIEILISWSVYIFSVLLQLRYLFLSPLLTGQNLIVKQQRIEIVFTVINISLFIFLQFILSPFLSLSLAFFVSVVVRIILLKSAIKISTTSVDRLLVKSVFSFVWPNTWRGGISNLAGFLIRNTTFFFIAERFSASTTGSYGLSFQLVFIIHTLSSIWINASYPTLLNFRNNHRFSEFRLLFINKLKMGILTYLVFSGILLLLGNMVLKLFHSNTLLLSLPALLLLVFHYFFDFVTNSFGYVIMTGNRTPFVFSSVITAMLTLFFTSAVGYFDLGIIWHLFASFVAALLFNYWYVTRMGILEFSKFS